MFRVCVCVYSGVYMKSSNCLFTSQFYVSLLGKSSGVFSLGHLEVAGGRCFWQNSCAVGASAT